MCQKPTGNKADQNAMGFLALLDELFHVTPLRVGDLRLGEVKL